MSLYYNAHLIATRRASFPGEVLVKEGEPVRPDTPILRANYRQGKLSVIRAAQTLGVSPEDLKKHVLRKEGDRVKWSETIAKRISMGGIKQIESPVDGVIKKIDPALGVVIVREILERPDVPVTIDVSEELRGGKVKFRDYILVKKGDRVEYGQAIAGIKIMPFIPVYTKKVASPCAGTIIEVDVEKGKVSIQKDFPTTELKAQYWGRIRKTIPQYGAEIVFGGYVLEGAIGTGDFAWGKLARDSTDSEDAILFAECPSIADLEHIIKERPRGIIVGSIDHRGIDLLEKRHIVSVIIEGFGTLPLSADPKKLLLRSMGRNIVLKAATQVRAGVVRPEIVIPSDKEYFACTERTDQLKVIWGPHYGRTGTLQGKPYLGTTSAGTKTWLCEITCDDGTVITLPVNNVLALKAYNTLSDMA